MFQFVSILIWKQRNWNQKGKRDKNLRKELETEKLAFKLLEKGYEKLTFYKKKKEKTAINEMKSV